MRLLGLSKNSEATMPCAFEHTAVPVKLVFRLLGELFSWAIEQILRQRRGGGADKHRLSCRALSRKAFDDEGQVLHTELKGHGQYRVTEGEARASPLWKSIFRGCRWAQGWHRPAGTASPTSFSLRHSCSCFPHHWKLRCNLKSVGL